MGRDTGQPQKLLTIKSEPEEEPEEEELEEEWPGRLPASRTARAPSAAGGGLQGDYWTQRGGRCVRALGVAGHSRHGPRNRQRQHVCAKGKKRAHE